MRYPEQQIIEQLMRLNDQLYLALKNCCECCRHMSCENSTSCTIRDALRAKEAMTQRMKGKADDQY